MDEDFAYLLEKMGPAIDRREALASSIERYRGKLPDQLLAYWQEHGWSGYADGLFWAVDPQEYEGRHQGRLQPTHGRFPGRAPIEEC